MTPTCDDPQAGVAAIYRADWLLPGPEAAPIANGGVAVDATGRIVALGPVRTLPDAPGRIEDLGHAVLMPGLVNAHQHGRGVSQLLMGYPDLPLEPWIAGRRRHGPPDIYAVTRLAAEEMLANGVCATLHGNYSYGSGDHAAEATAQIAAYRDAGLRTTFCVGVQDRGATVYPDGNAEAFVRSLPAAARAALHGAGPAFPPDRTTALALMDRLAADIPADGLIRLAWGPAGPQWVADATWRWIAADAARRGIGVHFHLLESPAQAAAARRLYPEGTLRRLRDLGVFEGPASCAHGVHMNAEDRRIAAAAGLTVVLNPGSNLRLHNGNPDVAALRAAGVPLAVGTDNCALADDEDLLGELRLATALGRTSVRGAGDSLAMVTTAGGRAAFLPDGYGRLAVGAAADFCAFSLDGIGGGRTLPPDRLLDLVLARGRGAACILTVVDGQVRFRASDATHARRAHWRGIAMASVENRAELADAGAIAALQDALSRHYAARLVQAGDA